MIGGKRLPKGIVHISVISETGRDGKPLELVIIFERAYADYGIALPHINVQLEGVVASAKEEQGVRSLLIQNVQGEARGAQRLVFYPEGNPNLSIHKPISQWDSSPSYYEPFKRYPTLHILR